ncbi:MAG: post-transcriptional regulator [Syntrophobacterales bacterium]|nr:post-transcriptional regulator [Syntrophobacterales bacterium]
MINQNKMGLIWIGVIVLCVTVSCGHKSLETISPAVQQSPFGGNNQIVILPFADYTPNGTPYEYWRRNILIMEALQDEFKKYGFGTAVEEDVIKYLLDKGIIQEAPSSQPVNPEVAILHEELTANWSDIMKQEIALSIYKNLSQTKDREEKFWNQRRLVSLNKEILRELGKQFNARFVVRGRIIDVSTGQEDSFNPVQTGILPFFFKLGSRTIFGIAQSETYEMIDKMALGGLMGLTMGSSKVPIEPKEVVEGHPRFGGGVVESNKWGAANVVIWGLVGSGASYLAHKGGRVDKAVVHIRAIVQDAETGEILWANRAEVKTTPRSVYGEHNPEVLLGRAIQDATASLVKNFVLSQVEGKYVTYDKYGTLMVIPKSATRTVGEND